MASPAPHLQECRPGEGWCAEGCPRYPAIKAALRPPEHPAAQRRVWRGVPAVHATVYRDEYVEVGPFSDDGERRDCERLAHGLLGKRRCKQRVVALILGTDEDPFGTYVCAAHLESR